ncbi:uncharacterized protein LOC133904932 [Phragmites australis]|uniref:uncharacterized protein LOC133904932 n=1 Tax=Phragmites australis TaxID=29695 RepID=UPI002D77A330|nr:uncharacterized protein LOC133904932 [Phragmites australis]
MKNDIELDNHWVVPHNLVLLKKYNVHINVEAVNKLNLVKYLFKYVMKGPDCAKSYFMAKSRTDDSMGGTDELENNDGIDEIAEYIKSRYLSTCEADWRLFGFEIHEKTPSVERLHVHLPGMNVITCHEEDDLQDIIDDPDSQVSMLTQWFITNQLYPNARNLTYCEFPTKWSWHPDKKLWSRRHTSTPKIGRLRFIHPRTGEAFYLRMLLMVVKGATYYEDIRTYQHIVYPTFCEACKTRGLIGDDTEWFILFDEAIIWATASQLRHLFMTIIVFSGVSNVQILFDKYWQFMADDISYRLHQSLQNNTYRVPDDHLKTLVIQELDAMFSRNGLSLSSYNFLIPYDAARGTSINRLLIEELSYNRAALEQEAYQMYSLLNKEQQHIFDTIITSIHNRTQCLYFVSGFGGTEKMYLWNYIISKLRSEGLHSSDYLTWKQPEVAVYLGTSLIPN